MDEIRRRRGRVMREVSDAMRSGSSMSGTVVILMIVGLSFLTYLLFAVLAVATSALSIATLPAVLGAFIAGALAHAAYAKRSATRSLVAPARSSATSAAKPVPTISASRSGAPMIGAGGTGRTPSRR